MTVHSLQACLVLRDDALHLAEQVAQDIERVRPQVPKGAAMLQFALMMPTR